MKSNKVQTISTGKLVEHRGQESSIRRNDMRITENGYTWDSIEEYMLGHEQVTNPLQQTIDGIFQEFTRKVKADGFEVFGEDMKSQEFVAALGSSRAFRELVTDVLFCADMPTENMNMTATAIAYMVFAGYIIHRAEPFHAAMTSVN